MNDRNVYPLENVNQCEHFENLFPLLCSPLKYSLYSNPSNTDGLRKGSKRMDEANDCLKSVKMNIHGQKEN